MTAPRINCPTCAEAERNPASGRVNADCKSCAARDLARGPAFFEASQAGAVTASYKSALQATFGEEWWRGHDEVKAWADKLQRNRA